MDYIEALDQLDAAAEHFAFKNTPPHEWRLHVRARGTSQATQVELQHWSGTPAAGYWNSVAHVSVSLGNITGKGLQLVTYINCTMCGRWSEQQPRARGLRQLFELADMFEDFTAGKTF